MFRQDFPPGPPRGGGRAGGIEQDVRRGEGRDGRSLTGVNTRPSSSE